MWITKASITATLITAGLGGIWGTRAVKPHHLSPPAAVLRPATASVMDPQAQAVITQAASATAALHSLKADYTYTVSASGGQARPETVRGRGTLVLQRPNLARVENGNVTVSDGSHRWFWAAAVNKYEETAVSQDGRDFDTNADVVPVVSFFFDPSLNGLHAYENKKDYDFRTSQPVSGPFPAKARFLGSENWRGLTCQVIEAVREVPYHNTLKVYLGPDHLIHRTVAERLIDFGTRKGQTETDELALTGLKTDAALPPSTFTFVPPPGSGPFPPKP